MSQTARKVETIVQPSEWVGPIFSSNTAASSFATIAPTVTTPATNSTTGVGIVGARNATLKLAFFGTDAANEAFDVKIVGWSRVLADIAGSDNKQAEWIPTPLALLTVTLGTATGASGGVVGGTSQLFADTIAEKATTGYSSSSTNILSPEDDLPGIVEIGHTGSQMIGVYFDMVTSASANALYMFT